MKLSAFVSPTAAQDPDKIKLEELIDRIPNLVNEYDVGHKKLVGM